MEEGLLALLLASAGIAGIVGTRIYPNSLPQGVVLPAISVTVAGKQPVYADDGEAGLTSARVQVECWALSYGAAKALARAVTDALSAFDGPAGDIEFQFITLGDERDFREGGSNAAEYRYDVQLDFDVWASV
jgi:hypothetical protein